LDCLPEGPVLPESGQGSQRFASRSEAAGGAKGKTRSVDSARRDESSVPEGKQAKADPEYLNTAWDRKLNWLIRGILL